MLDWLISKLTKLLKYWKIKRRQIQQKGLITKLISLNKNSNKSTKEIKVLKKDKSYRKI